MDSGFILGKRYSRVELLEYVGSKQQQSGIIWGEKRPEVVICTSGGKHGAEAAYTDRPHADGTWAYFGQGAKGDQSPDTYANQLLVQGQRSVLLFTTREPTASEARTSGNRKKQYTFMGGFCVGSWDNLTPESGKRKGDSLLTFTLVPINEADETFPQGHTVPKEKDEDLMAKLRSSLRAMDGTPKKGTYEPREYFRRSDLLKKYIRMRANGYCEYCKQYAPFLTPEGLPFLEIHHIFRLADDGPDEPENAVALCPNCHRNAHYGKDAGRIRDELSKITQDKESATANPA
jgi:5-methylcytosine-specific restriction protein A